ncbi:hypothetical protein MSAN_02476000 [Mycena sanguinolenta]|uniref:Uncharacterized protein n=1 Tax=Mycena sanguinolenta TaxID=230812 RepID=A0A8H6U419_9AGAR|nr:hypothetical protein MSAN_02476000 [Mycena sanguinolenta]
MDATPCPLNNSVTVSRRSCARATGVKLREGYEEKVLAPDALLDLSILSFFKVIFTEAEAYRPNTKYHMLVLSYSPIQTCSPPSLTSTLLTKISIIRSYTGRPWNDAGAAILLCAYCLRVNITPVGKLPVFHQRQPPPPSQNPSSWSPTQSAAPFGQPDFAAGEPLSDGGWNHSFNIEHLFASDVGYVGASNRAMAANRMNSDVRAMWANAPTNFELEDWGQYFLAMSHWSKTSGTPR